MRELHAILANELQNNFIVKYILRLSSSQFAAHELDIWGKIRQWRIFNAKEAYLSFSFVIIIYFFLHVYIYIY